MATFTALTYTATADQQSFTLTANDQDRADIPVPDDVVVADSFSADATASTKSIADVDAQELILDIGPETAERFAAMLKNAGTIIWNGPMGIFH